MVIFKEGDLLGLCEWKKIFIVLLVCIGVYVLLIILKWKGNNVWCCYVFVLFIVKCILLISSEIRLSVCMWKVKRKMWK